MTNRIVWLQAADGDTEIEYAALDDRALLASLVRDEGVFDIVHGDLRVTERAAGADFSVDVAAGCAFVRGDDVSGQGIYMIQSDEVQNVEVPAPPASGDRIHRVVAQVRDKLHNSTDWDSYDWVPMVLEDTGSGKPDLPDSAIDLGEIYVTSGQTSVTNDDINDMRRQACLITSKYPVLSQASDYTSLAAYESEVRWRLDLECFEVYDGAAWREIPRAGGGGDAWPTYTPNITGTESNPSLGSGATAQGRYIRYGRMVHVEVIIKFGSGMTRGGGFYEVSLPVTARSQSIGRRTGSSYVFDNSANEFYDGISFINSGATTKVRLSINSDVVQDNVPVTFAASDELGFSITYEAAS